MEHGKILAEVDGERIVVTMEGSSFRAIYYRNADRSKLLQSIVMSVDKKHPHRHRREDFVQLAWEAANAKARELGWIGLFVKATGHFHDDALRLAISLVHAKYRAMSRVPNRLGFIPPQLPTLTDQPPEGANWIHEVKHDGYRTLLVIERDTVRAYTRNGFDWSDRYPGIVQAAAKLGCRSAILDGEVIVQDACGVSDFESLRFAMYWQPHRLIFYAFDLLHLNGKDLRKQPLLDRRAELEGLMGHTDPALQFSQEFTGDAAAFFRACADHKLEGMVSKLASSRYRSGRSKTWLKTKCFTESELVIIGIDRDRKTGATRALLAKANGHALTYAGAAFIGLSSNAWDSLREQLQPINRAPLTGLRMKDAQWVKPRLTAKVRHLAGAKYLRHAVVKALD
jgi:DNA ligase D-like protein (predicted ligase)